MAANRQTPPTTSTSASSSREKPHAGYAESSTERDALGQGDSKPRDRGEYRIDGQDPAYGSRARDSDDAASNNDAPASEFGGRKTADDRTADTDEDAGAPNRAGKTRDTHAAGTSDQPKHPKPGRTDHGG